MNNSEENFLREIPEKVFVKVTNEKGLPVISLSILLIFKSDYKNDFAYVLTKKKCAKRFFRTKQGGDYK